MDIQEILKFFLRKGLLVDKDVLNLFTDAEDVETAKLIIEKIGARTKKRIITKNLFEENKEQVSEIILNLPEETQKNVERLKIRLGLNIQISKEIIHEMTNNQNIIRTPEFNSEISNTQNNFEIAPISNTQNNSEMVLKSEEQNDFRDAENRKFSASQTQEMFKMKKTGTGNFEDEKKQEVFCISNIGRVQDVKIISNFPALSKRLEVDDFVKYFRNRLNDMSGFLQERLDTNNLVSINKIFGDKQNIFVIGLVSDKRTTKNKNILLEVEDLTGKIRILVNNNKPELYEKAEDIALDSVLGFKCSGNREILFANDIIFPDSYLQERKFSPYEEYVLFIGDLHVGSKLFLENNFNRFIDYLNGNVLNTPEVKKIKYIFIVGDLVAGVGIYPGQENELLIPDVEAQYEKVAELLNKIRKDIKIILSPGNHDSLRIMEPQPIFDEKYSWPLYDLKNVIMTGNPSQVNIGARENFSGFNVLTYHGYSYHYYASNIPKLIREKATHSPEKIMHYLLKNRHLAPTHSSTLYFPSENDPFIIKNIPDILVSAHTHKSAVSYYNNILTISISSWESMTAFQEKMGNEPDFCKVPMLNLKTRAIKMLDFE